MSQYQVFEAELIHALMHISERTVGSRQDTREHVQPPSRINEQ
jgi:hypothetical protein